MRRNLKQKAEKKIIRKLTGINFVLFILIFYALIANQIQNDVKKKQIQEIVKIIQNLISSLLETKI